MSEKLCLTWNDFQEEGRQFEAHRVILAASSPFFQKLLENNQHPHPLVYMKGLKSDDLVAIADFLYCGEANVYQENLDSFLAIAEELQLKGLMGKAAENTEHTIKDEKLESQMTKPMTKLWTSNGVKTQKTFHEMKTTNRADKNNTVALSNHFSGDLEELEQRVQSMMEKSQNDYANGHQKADICKECGKEGMGSNIKEHIEANHLEGIIVPCNLCEKTFRYRNGLRKHKTIEQSVETKFFTLSENGSG